jgi:hypothetical protein
MNLINLTDQLPDGTNMKNIYTQGVDILREFPYDHHVKNK